MVEVFTFRLGWSLAEIVSAEMEESVVGPFRKVRWVVRLNNIVQEQNTAWSHQSNPSKIIGNTYKRLEKLFYLLSGSTVLFGLSSNDIVEEM